VKIRYILKIGFKKNKILERVGGGEEEKEEEGMKKNEICSS
jgi:hypothetical protein